ncbi:hypothetical protein CDL12_11059 [Handroanthus impetiginosus]|uniref:ZF-HD dimerization-type domain-containing protein n=1 Tax=Handroanthus impetiginosus TaxID=429701 RepID=A0A2G9HFI0_9LAMI|nr:hypothetical protein CDL12_11059 [Handroanthus impetiginosus]
MAANNNENIEYVVTYTQCLHNHAAHTMNYVFDGCGLFEPSGPNGTPEAMVCAACHCHRNFHRIVIVELPPRFNAQDIDTNTIPVPPPQPQTFPSHIHQQTASTSNHAHNRCPRPRITPQQGERLGSHVERDN